ncbi:MAG: DUF58 domain-containing protein [Pyrinomonadaceae bacterium]
MNIKMLAQLFSFREIGSILLKILLIIGGLGVAGLTVWAHRTGNVRIAGIAAIASLAFVLLILIFIVPSLARSASSEASQMNLPFEFTTGGAIYFGLLIIVAFAAWNTGNNLLFLVLAFLSSTLVVGFFVGSFCLKKLDVKMRFPETIFAGEATPIIVSLHNRKRIFPTFSVIAEVRGRERENSPLADELKKILPARLAEKIIRPPILKHTLDYFVYIPRRDSVENKAEHIFENRGRFVIKDFELSTRFPFGFFRHRRRLSAQEAEIIVYPKIEPVEVEILKMPFEVGKLVAPKKGAGQDLLSLRDYQPQDDLRHVDWKATARARRIIVREFAAEDERRVTVIFDSRLQEAEKQKTLRERIEEEQKGKRLSPEALRFEKGVSQTASLLAYFTDEQAEIRLVIDDEIGEFGFGKTHLYDCLKRLAVVEPKSESTSDFSAETVEEIFTMRENSYTFFVTEKTENSLLDEIVQRAKVIRF